MIVMKFGGTSVASAERLAEVAAIIEQTPSPRLVVVSAAGGITNLLLDAARAAAAGQSDQVAERTAEIRRRHEITANALDSPPGPEPSTT